MEHTLRGNDMKLYCTHNFVMEEGDTAFTAGQSYNFDYTGDEYYAAIDDEGTFHMMHVTDLLGYFIYLQQTA